MKTCTEGSEITHYTAHNGGRRSERNRPGRLLGGILGGLLFAGAIAGLPQAIRAQTIDSGDFPSDLTVIAPETVPLDANLYRISTWPNAPLPLGMLLERSDTGQVTWHAIGGFDVTCYPLYWSPSKKAVFADDTVAVASRMLNRIQMNSSGGVPVPDPNDPGGDGDTNNVDHTPHFFFMGSSNLWIQCLGAGGGFFNAQLWNASNGVPYLVTSTQYLDPSGTNTFGAEGWFYGTTNDATGFWVGVGARTNLFMSAVQRDDCPSTQLPLDWQLAWFGVTGLDPNTNIDGTGATLLYQCQNNLDPNKISFFAQFDNYAISSTNVAGSFELYGGIPAQMAAVIGTNWESAVWQAYSSNFVVCLGPTNGNYDLWLGLKGCATNAHPTWNWSGFTLNLNSPSIVLTEPASATGSRPIIQVRGYSPRQLFSVSYDVYGGEGAVAVSNAPAYITSREFEPGTMVPLRDWFELVDVPLAPGANTVTLRATADDGLTSTNTYTFTLDFTGATNPPALTVFFPQDGEVVCGDNFTFRGEISDPTATANAQVIDASGNTNEPVAAIVERNGLVWAENLPLGPGTNTLVLTMTDAATNASMVTLSVIQSEVSLTIDDVPPETLNNPTVTVTGKISSNDYLVWVNGVQANSVTDNGDGTWSWQADGVPLDDGGTALFQARAIPKAVNGGGGSGQQTPQRNRVTPNPTASGQKSKEKPEEKDACVFLAGYNLDFSQLTAWSQWPDQVAPPAIDTGFEAIWRVINWTNKLVLTNATNSGNWCFGNFYEVDSPGYTNWSTWTNRMTLPLDEWPYQTNGIMSHVTATDSGITGATSFPSAQPDPTFEFWRQHTTDPAFGALGSWRLFNIDKEEGAIVKLRTGGKGSSKRQSLFHLTATAQQTRGQDAFGNYAMTNVASTNIVMNGKQLDTNALAWFAFPDNKEYEITPKVNALRYSFTNWAVKHKFISICESLIPTNRDRTVLGVGERVTNTFAYAPWGSAIIWSASDGSISPTNSWTPTFTAPSNRNDHVIITATVNGVVMSNEFCVVEPTGVVHADIISTNTAMTPGESGAGMHLRVYLGPTNVSFYRLKCWETGQNATNITGYYTNTYPNAAVYLAHNSARGANKWFRIEQDNSWEPDWDQAGWVGDQSPWSTGGFKWVIPWKWKVEGGKTNEVAHGWEQEFTLGSDGTMTVEKFNRGATRGTNGVYSVR